MRQADRLSTVLERISGSGSVGVGELADELGVSPATIRRDLRLLEEQHLLARTHGGAVGQGVLYELPLRYRNAGSAEKRRMSTVHRSDVGPSATIHSASALPAPPALAMPLELKPAAT